jgi:chemotaxis methyl-accepting protein methylase/ribosomal protein S18 acetylase RimI-like enzyme
MLDTPEACPEIQTKMLRDAGRVRVAYTAFEKNLLKDNNAQACRIRSNGRDVYLVTPEFNADSHALVLAVGFFERNEEVQFYRIGPLRPLELLGWDDDEVLDHFKALLAELGWPLPGVIIEDGKPVDNIDEKPLTLSALRMLAGDMSPSGYYRHLSIAATATMSATGIGSYFDAHAVPFLKEFGISPKWHVWFRYHKQLKSIKKHVDKLIGALPEGEPIKILVHASWHGEDAYAIAVMLDHFYSASGRKFEITGVDFVTPNPDKLNWAALKRIPKFLTKAIPKYFLPKTDTVIALNDKFKGLVKFRQGDIRDSDSFGEDLDMVVANSVLGHFVPDNDDIRKSIENAHSALKPGGRFYVDNHAYTDGNAERANVNKILKNHFIETGKFKKIKDSVYEKVEGPLKRSEWFKRPRFSTLWKSGKRRGFVGPGDSRPVRGGGGNAADADSYDIKPGIFYRAVDDKKNTDGIPVLRNNVKGREKGQVALRVCEISELTSDERGYVGLALLEWFRNKRRSLLHADFISDLADKLLDSRHSEHFSMAGVLRLYVAISYPDVNGLDEIGVEAIAYSNFIDSRLSIPLLVANPDNVDNKIRAFKLFFARMPSLKENAFFAAMVSDRLNHLMEISPVKFFGAADQLLTYAIYKELEYIDDGLWLRMPGISTKLWKKGLIPQRDTPLEKMSVSRSSLEVYVSEEIKGTIAVLEAAAPKDKGATEILDRIRRAKSCKGPSGRGSGNAAELLRYMHGKKVYWRNRKTSKELGEERGLKQRTAQRELQALLPTGLVLGNKTTGYYLPEWLRGKDILGDIIERNPELLLASLHEHKDAIDRIRERVEENIIFTSENETLEVVQVTVNNFSRYKKAILRIANSLPDTGLADGITNYVRQYEDALAQGIISDIKDTIDYVAKVNGKVIGYVFCSPMTKKTTGGMYGTKIQVIGNHPKKARELYLWAIGVNKKYHRKGIGNLLLRLAAQESKRHEIPMIYAELDYNNEQLKDFLENRGFGVTYVAWPFTVVMEAKVQKALTQTEKLISRMSIGLRQKRDARGQTSLTPLISKSTLEEARKAFGAVGHIIRGRSEKCSLNKPVSALGGSTTQGVKNVSKLRLCVPVDVLKESADIALALNKLGNLRGAVPFELVVTGVEGEEDKKMIEALNRSDIQQALKLPENLTVSVITEDRIQKIIEAGKFKGNNLVKRRAEIIGFLSSIDRRLEPNEYMAIATDGVSKDDAIKLQKKFLKDRLEKNISIRVLVRPGIGRKRSMYSLSKIINNWLTNIKNDHPSTVKIILPVTVSPAEMIQRLDEAIRAAWEVLRRA